MKNVEYNPAKRSGLGLHLPVTEFPWTKHKGTKHIYSGIGRAAKVDKESFTVNKQNPWTPETKPVAAVNKTRGSPKQKP